MRIGIFVIDVIFKEMNVGECVFGPSGNILVLISIDPTRIVFKIGVIYLAYLEAFIQI